MGLVFGTPIRFMSPDGAGFDCTPSQRSWRNKIKHQLVLILSKISATHIAIKKTKDSLAI